MRPLVHVPKTTLPRKCHREDKAKTSPSQHAVHELCLQILRHVLEYLKTDAPVIILFEDPVWKLQVSKIS